MNHPFIADLQDKTLEELQETMNTLSNRRLFMSRMGKHDMVNQISLVINSYQEEYSKRQEALWNKTFKKAGETVKVEDVRKT